MTNLQDATAVKKNKQTTDNNARKSKKTVHAIAVNEPIEDHFEMAVVSEMDHTIHALGASLSEPTRFGKPLRKVASAEANEISCALMSVALQDRSMAHSDSRDRFTELAIQQVLEKFESGDKDRNDQHDPLSREDLVGRLRSVSDRLHRGEIQVVEQDSLLTNDGAQRALINAVHWAISSLCFRDRFDEAVERSSCRAIYEFAYGLTHEINNPLANIAARAQQLIANVATESDKRSLATIVDQAMRAHEMLAEMMRVVQPKPISRRIEDVVEIVRDAVQIPLKEWSNAKIQCDIRLPSNPMHALVDRASLMEAISSVVMNSLQVCRMNDRIEVICHEVEAGSPNFGPISASDSTESSSDGSKPKRIRLLVRDTGPGLSPQALARAWDLYYSGREHGRGLGISLANVRRILDAHEGLVWIESALNAGCAVEFRLPKLPDPELHRRTLSI